MRISKKTIIIYYLSISILYVIAISALPFGFWNYTPIFYMFLGPLTFGIAFFSYGELLNTHVKNHHFDLMKNHSLSFGIRKGSALNSISVLTSQNEFKQKNDLELHRILGLYSYCFRFVVLSFISLIIITIVQMQLRFAII